MARKPLYSKDLKPRIKEFADRIIDLYELSNDDERREGQTWYDRCLAFVQALADNHDRTVADVAAVLAVLSPSTTLEQNIIDTINVLAGNDEAKVGTYGPQHQKALAVRDLGFTPDEVLGKNKTAAFWSNIVNPQTAGRVTVDRHAARVATGWTMTADESYYYVNTPAKYSVLETAYRLAADRLDLLPHQLQAITWITFKRLFVAKKRSDTAEVIPF